MTLANTRGPGPPIRRVVSYDQRAGRMTAGQRQAWQRLWPRYGRDAAEVTPPLDAAGWFGRSAPLVLEIGSGMGESTAALAAASPETSQLAVEMYQPGLAQLLMRLDAAGCENLRLLRGDAVQVLAELIEPGSLAGIRIYFPDPWPKRRHHKRRLVQPPFLALAASRLADGATLHMATDWAEYAEEMQLAADAEPLLRNLHADAPGGWAPRPGWRPMTKFEQRAVRAGRVVRDLIYQRGGGAARR